MSGNIVNMKRPNGYSLKTLMIYALLHFMFLSAIHGQIKPNTADMLSKRFLQYCQSVPREEVFVHTDKQEYIAGEDMWFNVYIIDRMSSKISGNSRIAYFELLNPDNRPVAQFRILINNGSGAGHIEVPDSLSSGTYLLRVYTGWMKNFLPENCFMKEISIYNAFNIKSFVRRINVSGGWNGVPNLIKQDSIDSKGLTFSVNNQNLDILELNVKSSEQYRSQNNFLFYLFIQTHGHINLVSSEMITGENTILNIPKKLLTPGINQISVFDSKGIPICERFVFTREKEKLDTTAIRSNDTCGTRSRVLAELDLKNQLQKDQTVSNLSISVSPPTWTTGTRDIDDYMVFASEFGPEPMRKINGRSIEDIPPAEMDNILLNAKSNWIKWSEILSHEPNQFRFEFEKEHHFIYGTLLTKEGQLAHPGEFLIMSTPSKVPVFQYTTTDYEANFSFGIPIDEELHDLTFQPDDTTKSNNITFDSEYSIKYFPCLRSVDTTGKYLPGYFPGWSASYQVRKIYKTPSSSEPTPALFPAKKTYAFYGKPGIEIVMKDYIKLPTMEEVIFELIPSVIFKSKNSGYEISIMNPYLGQLYDYPPVVLIDGIKINNLSIVANLDPELVEKIDVVREMYHVGDYLFYGIVNIITKTGDFSCVTPPDYFLRKKYRITDPVKEFVSPDYSSQTERNSRIPDFRNTLYWNPSVKPDKDGKVRVEFWTSDIRTDYEINIQGITGDGKIISGKKIIQVK